MPQSAQDRLQRYVSKRDFNATPEPQSGGEAGSQIFVVQHHWARRDHYDFRLEMNGVLVSWAVTRGPSLDPADKRLAVRTEDHPLSYAEFEGLIPKGEYGGGTVMLWDRGTWEAISPDPDKALEEGSLKIRLFGERMRGGWSLVRLKPEGKRENWLLIKEKDEAADRGDPFVDRYDTSVATGRTKEEIEEGKKPKRRVARRNALDRIAEPPAFVPPTLCETREQPPLGEDWIYEIKYDGYRLQAACAGDAVRLYTREGHDWTPRFANVAEALRKLGLNALIDGEAVVFDGRGLSDFAMLVSALEQSKPTAFVAFDILKYDDEDVSSKPLLARKEILAKALAKADGGTIRVAPFMDGDGEALFRSAVAGGAEGLICKKANAAYRSGRSPTWVKVKGEKREDVVIVGYSPSDKRAFASLAAAVEDQGVLRYAGRFGTGFSDKELKNTFARLEALRLEKPPANLTGHKIAPRKTVWVEPVLRAEIALAGWTGDAQIRQGRFLGWREDRVEKPVPLPKARPAARTVTTKAAVSGEASPLARITHGDRVMYPETGTTKLEIAEYYMRLAPLILPHLENRPVSFVRAPEGLGQETFFQRHPLPGMKRGIARVPDPKNSHEDYLLITGVDGLITAAQFSVIEFHGWGAKAPGMDRLDRVIFDLDPDDAVPFARVRDAAQQVRDVLEGVGLKSFPMISGGKGIHVIAPLDETQGWEAVGDFAIGIARGLAASDPENFIATQSKALRRGKIYIDWVRNRRTATAILPWSLRARPKPTIATPVTWKKLDTITTASSFTAQNLKKIADPWPEFFDIKQCIPEAALQFLNTKIAK